MSDSTSTTAATWKRSFSPIEFVVEDRELGVLEHTALISQDAYDKAKREGCEWPRDLGAAGA